MERRRIERKGGGKEWRNKRAGKVIKETGKRDGKSKERRGEEGMRKEEEIKIRLGEREDIAFVLVKDNLGLFSAL